ncbi:fumarylacetoacetate hydrolase family protein [Herbiconiux sp. CPCC 203407]|uniref:Fumarylacetoacetate hydrolase family protein n=1 Tax=Herbiconiux oxytropis TaxID=2970915 RepID=A0AA41XET0_9MICO|nr:fumarylacetoacetate hydrolase family protein [Herbiconiux oxytropis]MCS5720768.1 fumarylacetoacetate hydrolase family protein [Herbiconiux oxytropis]MCS5724905.1 fumarylacetoacetate hydrolase family protein [Herbiconiux oxytropis]
MRLVTFARRMLDGAELQAVVLRAGILHGDRVVDIDLALAAAGLPARGGREPGGPSELIRIIGGGERALDEVQDVCDAAMTAGREGPVTHPATEVQLVAPLPRPNSLRDFLAIEEHMRGSVAAGVIQEVPDEWYRIPAHYKGNVDEIYGPDDTIPWPAFTDKLDYELEICAVIGAPGRRIAANDASEHIVGYTLYNDWSARDIQAREMSIGIGPGICKDFGSSIGPCIATPDEFDWRTAALEARVDGEVWSAGTVGTMQFSFEEIVEWTSQEQTLRPGDLLGSGTIARGCGVEIGRWINEGSVVELEAEGIGILRNQVGRKGEGPSRAVELDATFARAR